MHKQVKVLLMQLSGVMALTIMMTVWRADFVIDGIKSNVMLNGIIIGTFAFGIGLIYFAAFKLKNEYTAFGALKQDYADLETDRKSDDSTDPMWKYYRCKDNAVVFKRPNLLRQPYLIISEEIARGKDLTLTPDVVSTLVDGIDARMSDQQSLINYVTGITVMLGLIGTFIGLLITLASIGSIIGGIDLSGGDMLATVQNLLDSLQVPLNGMATGFSSSLFGLISSLVLGILARFFSLSTGALSVEFEGWLVSISKIDAYDEDEDEFVSKSGEKISSQSSNTVSVMEGRYLELIMRVARFNVLSNTKANARMDAMSEAITTILEKTKGDAEVLKTMTDHLQGMNQGLNRSSEILEATLQTIDEKNKSIGDLRSLQENYHTLSEKTQNTADQLDNSITKLSKTLLSAVDYAAQSSSEATGKLIKAQFEDDMQKNVAERLYSKIYYDFKDLGYSLDGVRDPAFEASDINKNLEKSLTKRVLARFKTKQNHPTPPKRRIDDHIKDKNPDYNPLDSLNSTLSEQLKAMAASSKETPQQTPAQENPVHKMQVNARVNLADIGQSNTKDQEK